MRIVCVSDTHLQGHKIKLPDGDVLLHSGDATWRGNIDEVTQFAEWLNKIRSKYKHVVFTPGNHDWLFQRDPKLGRDLIEGAGAILLLDQETIIDGKKFYGSPWQPWFYDWAFNLPRGKALKSKWDLIPVDTKVLITHGPPYEILDLVVHRNEHVGCEELLEAVERIQPELHSFGHIHCAYGHTKIGNTQFVNASSCDEDYMPVNPPIVIDL